MNRPVLLEPTGPSDVHPSRREIHRSAAVSTARALGELSDELEGAAPGLSQHVADVALRVAMALGLPTEDRVQAYLAGFVRDIGTVTARGEGHALAGASVVRGVRGL